MTAVIDDGYYAPHPARDFEICTLHSGGEKLQEIADRYGLSRERVRQILKKRGLRSVGTQRDDPFKVLALVPSCRTVLEIAQRLGVDYAAVTRVLRALAPTVVEEMAAYREDAVRTRYITRYRALAQELGRVPTAADMMAHKMWFTYTRHFGNFAGLRRAAGLSGGPRVGRAHLTPEERRAIAERYRAGIPHYPGNGRQLQAEFHVSAQTIRNCVRRPVL